jgi:ATP:corrinoid adenosyltransferase
MPLPILTTSEDVRALVEYLKSKPTGATITEAKAVLKKQVLDHRKISAYIFWDIISKDDDKLKLSPRGWELARDAKKEPQVFSEVIDSIVPYRSAIEWIHHQQFSTVTNIDIAAHWHEHHPDALGTDKENTIKDQAVCFLRLCDAAKLGSLKMGRRGQLTRLTVNRSSLKNHIESGPSAPPWTEPTAEPEEPHSDSQKKDEELTETEENKIEKKEKEEKGLRVFISHGKNKELVEQVETLLGLADIDSEIAIKEETSAIPVPDKVFAAMRRCTAGIIIVSAEEGNKDAKGNYRINENVLIEIGAAFVLYDRRVVLLWDKRLPIPSNLQGLYRCEYEGDDLNWGAGMKLMKAIKGFKKK